MALWKDATPTRKDGVTLTSDAPRSALEVPSDLAYSRETTRRPAPREGSESVIGADLTIEGKVEGSGHLRIAGRFTGDVVVDGNLTIEPGARLAGGVRAHAISIAGELEGNVIDATRVDLLATGVLIGDLKADAFTVAAGSRMRGRVEFGWNEAVGTGARANGSAG